MGLQKVSFWQNMHEGNLGGKDMTTEEAIRRIEMSVSGFIIAAEFDEKEHSLFNVAREMAITALRAQQEAEKNDPLHGCDFCNGFDFSSASTEVTKYGAHIKIAGGAYRYPPHEWFNYCQVCGKSVRRPPEKEV